MKTHKTTIVVLGDEIPENVLNRVASLLIPHGNVSAKSELLPVDILPAPDVNDTYYRPNKRSFGKQIFLDLIRNGEATLITDYDKSLLIRIYGDLVYIFMNHEDGIFAVVRRKDFTDAAEEYLHNVVSRRIIRMMLESFEQISFMKFVMEPKRLNIEDAYTLLGWDGNPPERSDYETETD